jgi:MFS family permease
MEQFIGALSRRWAGLRYRIGEARWARSLWRRIRAPRRSLRERTLVDHNIHYLYVEIFWAAIFSAVFSFNATYALRLGATNEMVGWLSSIPALFAMVMMVPVASFIERRSNPYPWTNGALMLGRFGFLSAAFVPWLFPNRAAEVIVALFIARTIPITVFNTGFSPMLADVIPERDRARVFANRNIIMSATAAVVTFLSGQWLDAAQDWTWAAFPLNYQLLYVVGGAAALMSAYFVTRIQPPPVKVRPEAPRVQAARLTLRRLRATAAELLTQQRDFAVIIANTLIFNLGAWMVGPLYMILFVRQLAASDSWVGLNTTLANLGVIVGYALWRRWLPRLGDSRALRLSVPLAASYALLVAIFPNLSLILVWGILINLINPGVNLSHTNVFYRVCPEERRASYMALYASVMNAGAFICPMIGVALSEIMDIRWVLVIGGVIRLLGGFMFYIWPVERTPALEAMADA